MRCKHKTQELKISKQSYALRLAPEHQHTTTVSSQLQTTSRHSPALFGKASRNTGTNKPPYNCTLLTLPDTRAASLSRTVLARLHPLFCLLLLLFTRLILN